MRAPDDIRDVNVRYHDLAAESYDAKWGIDYGPAGQAQVLGKLRKSLGAISESYERSLEIGAGTGYFSLNLLQAGVIENATCTDISPGMVETLRANAERLGLDVEAAVAEAQDLPCEDERFDLVLGHAVLHHLPDLSAAFAELHRVLRPGGLLVFAGEPSRWGDRIAEVPKRSALLFAPLWRLAMRVPAANGHDAAQDELERHVDVHAFSPRDLARHARAAGFDGVRVVGEELLANWFGWANRVLEATAEPSAVPMAWRRYAYHGYLALQRADARLFEGRLPASIFYNLLLVARKPR
jgi:ubiquinone/menaquinone biosynthesis C-methylase UbiE